MEENPMEQSSKNERILLWPQGAPGSEDWDQLEEEIILPRGLKVVRNVTQPSLTVFPADQAKASGTAVIVCPGGAFHMLSIDMEGNDVARWLAARGVTAFVLRYRLIRTGEDLEADLKAHFADQSIMGRLMQPMAPLLLADGQQAVQLVRERAAEWKVSPDQVGMMGFSAGGSVTANAVLYNSPDCRPDFAAPIYPAVFEDVVAPVDAPPLFLLCANDDEMAVNGCLRLYSAWRAASRPAELHIYSKGGHGFGMTRQDLPSDTWIERFADWLRDQGLMTR
jgi:acetyl esterase/lipase